jgi:hypothetical protein
LDLRQSDIALQVLPARYPTFAGVASGGIYLYLCSGLCHLTSQLTETLVFL